MDLPIYTACIIKMKVGDPWWPNWTLVSKQENNGKPCQPWCFSNLISSSFAGYSSPFFETTRFVASGNGKRWTPKNKHKSWRNKGSFFFFRKSFAYYTDDSFQPWIMKMSKKLRILPTPQTDMVNTANRMLHKGLPNSFPAPPTAFRKHCPGMFLPPKCVCVCAKNDGSQRPFDTGGAWCEDRRNLWIISITFRDFWLCIPKWICTCSNISQWKWLSPIGSSNMFHIPRHHVWI